MTFGKKLQLLRKQKGISQEQLASLLTVSRQAISKWELDNSLPDTENVIMISELFDVSTDYLLKDYVENTKESLECVSSIKDDLIPICRKKEKIKIFLGITCVLFSCLSFFVVWILEKIYPAPIICYNSTTHSWKVGLDNFIWVHGLEDFMRIIGALFVIGIGLIFNKQIKRIIQKFLQICYILLYRIKYRNYRY